MAHTRPLCNSDSRITVNSPDRDSSVVYDAFQLRLRLSRVGESFDLVVNISASANPLGYLALRIPDGQGAPKQPPPLPALMPTSVLYIVEVAGTQAVAPSLESLWAIIFMEQAGPSQAERFFALGAGEVVPGLVEPFHCAVREGYPHENRQAVGHCPELL